MSFPKKLEKMKMVYYYTIPEGWDRGI